MRQGKPITYQTPQELQNQSFDRDYQVNVVEPVVYNPVTESLDRMVQPATSISQETLNSLVETLQELTTRLTAIAATVANTQQLRVVQASVPSTAVTGPITSANSIAEKAVGGISYAEKMAITNNTAILANVNNCIGK